MSNQEEPQKGDYVLATKWPDGDSRDHWFVGFFVAQVADRFFVSDANGNSGRCNGFSRCQKIHPAIGEYLVKNSQTIESIKLNLWEYVNSSIHETAIKDWNYEHREGADT